MPILISVNYPCQLKTIVNAVKRRGGIPVEYGTIKIKLDELIRNTGISKNMLSHRAEMQRSQINHYCNNTISRLDIDVLARICTVLDCSISDLLEFVPSGNNKIEK